MKNILLIGGTGAIGMYLAPYLIKDGYKVYITSRSERVSTDENLVYLQGNGKDIEWLKETSKSIDFSSIVDFMMYDYKTLKTNYKDLLSLGEQYIYLSSYRALATANPLLDNSPRKVDLVKEDPELGEDKYGMTKGYQENLFRDSSSKNWTIVRPSMTFSKNRFQFGAMDNWDIFRTVRGGSTVLPEGMWTLPATLVYGKDVALMISRLVDNEKALAQSFNVVTEDAKTWQEISSVYNKVFGLHVSKIISNEEYIKLTGQSRTMVDRLLPRIFDNSHMLEVTGLKNSDFHSLEEGLKEAWSESSYDRYYMGNTNWKIQAPFDVISESRLDLSQVSDAKKKIYFTSLNKTLKEKQEGSPWEVRETEHSVLLRRCGAHILKKLSTPDKYAGFILKESLVKGKVYSLSFASRYDGDLTYSIFLSNAQGQLQSLGKIKATDGEWENINLVIDCQLDDANKIMVSTDDFKISGKILEIKNISTSYQGFSDLSYKQVKLAENLKRNKLYNLSYKIKGVGDYSLYLVNAKGEMRDLGKFRAPDALYKNKIIFLNEMLKANTLLFYADNLEDLEVKDVTSSLKKVTDKAKSYLRNLKKTIK